MVLTQKYNMRHVGISGQLDCSAGAPKRGIAAAGPSAIGGAVDFILLNSVMLMANKQGTKMAEDLKELAAEFRAWVNKINDAEDDCGYLNGDSDKYAGDAWEDIEALVRRLEALTE
jgi:hypothetical protein